MAVGSVPAVVALLLLFNRPSLPVCFCFGIEYVLSLVLADVAGSADVSLCCFGFSILFSREVVVVVVAIEA